jgi:hydroxymethylpyrimidine kinase/phosphomethylpyrimidine kinase
MEPPRALTIAGSDSGGGAGISADLKTFAAHGVWGTCALTAVTAQDTTGVLACQTIEPNVVARQIEAVAADIGVHAAKTGMMATAPTVVAVADTLRSHLIQPLVVDPVMATGHHDSLLTEDGLAALRELLVPLAAVVVPNLAEAAQLARTRSLDDESDMRRAAEVIGGLGAKAVLVTGGHLEGDPVDLLWRDGEITRFGGRRIALAHTHGTGCVLSAAITARLARGEELVPAVAGARDYVRAAIRSGLAIGSGRGPVNPPRDG